MPLRLLFFMVTAALGMAIAHPSATAPGTGPSLQHSVDAVMRGRAGSAVIIDVASGRLLAAHRLNVAARRLVRPGSTVKTFALLAMLRGSVVKSDTTLVCDRRVFLNGRRLNCSHINVARALDPPSALAYSCNYWFAHFARQLSDTVLTETLLSAGLTSPTGLLTGEAVGSVKRSNSTEELQLKALGEANIRVTPLELLFAYRGLALRQDRADPALNLVLSGLRSAADFGTAQLAQVSGMPVAGKTGTALADEGRWTHGWFVGFAPADHPQIALVVFLERGNGPGDAAAIAGEILRSYARQQNATLARPQVKR